MNNTIFCPSEGQISPILFKNTIKKTLIPLKDNLYVFPGESKELFQIFTDNSVLCNYSVYLSCYKKFSRTIILHSQTSRPENCSQHLSFYVSGVNSLKLTTPDSGWAKEITHLFRLYLDETLEIIDSEENCLTVRDGERAKKISFLSKFLGNLYEDIFLFGK